MIKLTITVVIFLIGLVAWDINFNKNSVNFNYNEQKLKLGTEVPKSQSNAFLDEINKKNSHLTTFKSNVNVVLIRENKTYRLNGSVYYRKEEDFRIELNSILGKEIDIGSNESQFWYWLNHGKFRGLYYTNNKQINKALFNPKWLSMSLGVSEIDYQNATIDTYENYWRVLKKENDNTICTLIDLQLKTMVGIHVYDNKNSLIASSEIKSFQNSNGILVPQTMAMRWNEEDVSINWKFQSIHINSSIDSKYWTMPELSPKFDMSKH
jgi:outer membrane lipoprotein-sorting protein